MREKILRYCRFCLFIIMAFSYAIESYASETIIDFTNKIKNGQDISNIIREQIEKAPRENLTLIFPKGKYYLSPKGSFKKKYNITNHENGEKNIAFLFDGFKNLKIEGNNTDFIFSGPMLPFLFVNSENIVLSNCNIDWSVPFHIQGEIVNVDLQNNSYDVRFHKKGYDFIIDNNSHLIFPNQNGFIYSSVGESLVFDKNTKSPVYQANLYDIHRKKQNVKVKTIENGDIRIFEKLKHYPPLGGIIVFKGPNGENRYAPAIHSLKSKNIKIEQVNVYYALGMGFLGEISENINLSKFNVCLREGSDRIISATADATHFCNCKGNVIVENCLFENMLDDGTNVHGTYVQIENILSKYSVKAKLIHFQQHGFEFARKGDKSWFIISPDPNRGYENTVSNFNQLNDSIMEISFQKPLPDILKKGDLIENKTWNTESFTMRNCIIHNHRARNIVLKTPGKTIIENNYFQSMMASILMRAEAFYWYESGANENVIIRNNTFYNCTLGGGEQALLYISPKFNKNFDKQYYVDKNIIFENNTINTFDNKIIYATSVDGLIIRNNKIIQTNDYKAYNPDKPLIQLIHCKNQNINEDNVYKFHSSQFIEIKHSLK